jgi:antitoxin StbD
MSALLERVDQAISVTEVIRSAKEIFTMLAKGKQDKFVVMRNNAPTAVLLPVSAYEALIEEVEDLRIEIVAIKRMRDFDRSKAITHDDMVKKFGSEGK